jgi:serine protease Do
MNLGKFKFYFINFILIIFFSTSVSAKKAPASFADLAEKLMPSVVNISTTQTIKGTASPLPFDFQFPPGSPFEDLFKDFNRPTERQISSLGSGFIIDAKGIVITNNHVIQNAEEIIVKVNGKKEFKAKILGNDPLSDVAVIEIISDETFTPVKFGDSDKARIGDWVIAIGNPFGFGGTVTSGIISARNREIGLSRYEDYIQTDASINQGNSGGPLFNLYGEVIGINTAILAPSAGSIGIGFAIPSNSASLVVNQLLKYGETKRGWLGVRIQEVTKEIAEVEQLDSPKGALVASVGENSPAGKAGIKPGDIILEFDDKDVDTMRTLPKIVALTEVGKNVIVKIWRNKKVISKKVLLGRLESSKEFASLKEKEAPTEIKSLKISARLLTEEDINQRQLPSNTTGVVITEIASDSPIYKHLQVNDIIVELQKTKVNNLNQLKDILKKSFDAGEKTLLFATYNNQNVRRYLGIRLK